MWAALVVVSAICLMVFWRGPNAVWGGLPLGALVGLAVSVFGGAPISWLSAGKGAVVGVLIGAAFELPRCLARRRAE